MEKCQLSQGTDLQWWLKAFSEVPADHVRYIERLIACRHFKKQYPDYTVTDILFELKASFTPLTNFCYQVLNTSATNYINGGLVTNPLEAAFVERVGQHFYLYVDTAIHASVGGRYRVLDKPIALAGAKPPAWIPDTLLKAVAKHYHYGTILALNLGV